METTNERYRLLVGLDDSWDVVEVDLQLHKRWVEIHLAYVVPVGKYEHIEVYGGSERLMLPHPFDAIKSTAVMLNSLYV